MRNRSNFNTYQTLYKYNTPIPEKTIYKNSVKLLLASSIQIQSQNESTLNKIKMFERKTVNKGDFRTVLFHQFSNYLK